MAALLQRLVPLVLLLNAAVVYGGNTTCIDPSVTWYYNAAGESPCRVFERLLDTCQPQFVMYSTHYPPTFDRCVNTGCCCNSIAYALYMACWSCQWGTPYPTTGNPTNYGLFLDEVNGTVCDGGLNFGVLQPQYALEMGGDLPPDWAYIPVTSLFDTWDYPFAMSNATKELAISSSVSMQSTLSVASTASVASASAASVLAALHHKKNTGAIAGGVVGGIAALAAIAAAVIVFLLRKRRSENPGKDPKAFIDEGPVSATHPTPFVYPSSAQGMSSTNDVSSMTQVSHVTGTWPAKAIHASYYPAAGSKFQEMPRAPDAFGANSSFPLAGSKAEEVARASEAARISTVTNSTSFTGSTAFYPSSSSSPPPGVPTVIRAEDAGLTLDESVLSRSRDELPPSYQAT